MIHLLRSSLPGNIMMTYLRRFCRSVNENECDKTLSARPRLVTCRRGAARCCWPSAATTFCTSIFIFVIRFFENWRRGSCDVCSLRLSTWVGTGCVVNKRPGSTCVRVCVCVCISIGTTRTGLGLWMWRCFFSLVHRFCDDFENNLNPISVNSCTGN